MNSADVGERPPLCLCCVFVFRASHVHGIGETLPVCLELALPDLFVIGGVVGRMADSNISDSLCLYRGGEPISDGGTLFCGDKVSTIPCLLKLLDLDSSCELPGMTVVSNSILLVSGDLSPVVLAEDTPPVFSLFGWWFFLPFISPSFSLLV